MEPPQPHQPPEAEHPTLSSMLLAGAQAMDPAAWKRLADTFGPIVYRWCRSSGIPEADAADVVQEVFSSVARSIGDFQRQKPQGSFRAWLATITRHRATDYFRKNEHRQRATGGTAALGALQQHPDALDSTICPASAEQPLLLQAVEYVRAEFEPATWQAFWLTAVEGQPARDVAQQLQLSTASVYQAKSRVLRRLRQRLAEVPE